MNRSRSMSVTMLVWVLVMVGLLTMVVTNIYIGWTISGLNQERQRLMQLDSQLVRASQKLREINQTAKSRTHGLLQFDHVLQIKGFPREDFALLQSHFKVIDDSQEMAEIISNMERTFGQLQKIWDKAADWRIRQQLVNADLQQKTTLNLVRKHLNQMRGSLESLEGQQRLTDALLLRRWRKATAGEAAKYAEVLFERQSFATKRVLSEAKTELMSISRMVEILAGEGHPGQLTDLKDNQLKPSLERIGQLLAILYREKLLNPDMLPPTVLEQLKEALFGQGYAIYKEYQTIRPGVGGLYQLARNRLLLRRERESYLTQINKTFQQVENIFPDLTELTRHRSQDLDKQVTASITHSASNMLLLGSMTLCDFWGLGWLFANIARKQVGELEKRDIELHELNRNLEEKVTDRTALLKEKSFQLIRTQKELLLHEKLAAIGSLAAGVAHEINNPVAIIRGNVEVLQMDLSEDAPEREELSEITKQVDRVALITQDMLNFAARRESHHEPVQLNELIEEVLANIGHQASLEGIRIQRDLEIDLSRIPGDRERLRQVFNNIILNALQAMDGSGTLSIHSLENKDRVEIIVRDTGPGIPQNLREKIFNPFFTTKKCGTGLGLSVSYGILQAHEGSIDVDSIPGQGGCFRVSLPTFRTKGTLSALPGGP